MVPVGCPFFKGGSAGDEHGLFFEQGLAVDAADFAEFEPGRHDLLGAVDAVDAVKVRVGLGGNLAAGNLEGILVELGLDGRGPVVFVGEFEIVFVLF